MYSRLRQEEEDQEDGDEVACREDIAVREGDARGDERCGETDEEIEAPVRGRAKRDADGSIAARIYLRTNGPGHSYEFESAFELLYC